MSDTPARGAITVIKRDAAGQEVWRYSGRLLHQDERSLVLEARFDKEDVFFKGMLLGKGDRFVETYYTDRWFNIFEIHAREDDHLRGWYCNVSCPAVIVGETIAWNDLALDLLVFPDGRQYVLDEDEFSQLELSSEQRQRALNALAELQTRFSQQVLTP